MGRRQSNRREIRELVRYLLLGLGVLGIGLATLYLLHLGAKRGRVLHEFELLASSSYYHVLAAPLHARQGMDARATGIASRLARAGLRRVRTPPDAGEFRVTSDAIVYVPARGSAGLDAVQLDLAGSVVSGIHVGDEAVDVVDLPPEHLTSFSSSMHERRAPVEWTDIPPSLVTAVLAAEDRRFFEHPGLDWRGIARAMFRNITHGRVVEGGSTITQQAVKIILNRTRRELPAKIDEAVLALFVERRFTKQEILTVYLNNVYLGQEGAFTVHGVAEGARYFFGKPLVDLSKQELLELAAAIRAPNAASPRRHRERLQEYTRAIAKAESEVKKPDSSAARDKEAPAADGSDWFEDALPAALESAAATASRFDFDAAQLGYYFDVLDREWQAVREHYDIERPATIVAGVDPLLQLRAAQALQRGLDGADKRAKRRPKGAAGLQGAVVSLDPWSGRLLAVVGGRDYDVAPFNRASDISRQVGSTFKPFVYLTAFDDPETTDLTQSTLLEDTPHQYRVGRDLWSPANFDGRFRGMVTVRQALEQSVNAATVELGLRVGIDRVAHLAEMVGVQDQVAENPSMLLGAVETSPLRLAGAYAPLANGGRTVWPHALIEVRREGRAIQPDAPASRRVASSAGTYIVTDMLQGALKWGTGASAARLGFTHLAAGKTGTSDQARDTWFVGYTSEIVTAVWVGYDDNSPTSFSGSSAALPVWASTMGAWLGQGWDRPFDQPPGIVFRDIDPLTGDMANSTCPQVETAAYYEDHVPQFYCTLHQPSFGDRIDHLFGPDNTRPETGNQPPSERKQGWWSKLKGVLGV